MHKVLAHVPQTREQVQNKVLVLQLRLDGRPHDKQDPDKPKNIKKKNKTTGHWKQLP